MAKYTREQVAEFAAQYKEQGIDYDGLVECYLHRCDDWAAETKAHSETRATLIGVRAELGQLRRALRTLVELAKAIEE